MATRPPPPDASRRAGAPTLASRMYGNNFRPVVIISALVLSGWSLVWGIGAFQDINVDKGQKETKFATLDIVLGIMYMVVCAIGLFGVIAVVMDRIIWARIYKFLALVAALTVVATGFIRTITHFIYKNNLIDECTQIVQGQNLTFRFGIWGPVVQDTLNPTEAAQFCKDGWNHDSFTEIVSLLVEIALMLFYVGIAFTYYKQLLDPLGGRAPAKQNRVDYPSSEFPEHYNPPYLGYDTPAPTYAPPAGPPPDFGKPPVFAEPRDDVKGYLDQDKDDDPFADFDSVHHSDGKVGESREALV